MSAFLISGLVLGFLGSLHCVGMCGPIALALPWKSGSRSSFIAKKLFYFISKASAYALLGILSGLIGNTFRFFGFQQYLSIVLGVIMLIAGIASLFHLGRITRLPVIDKALSILRSMFAGFLNNPKPSSFIAVGFLNGFLPCGFVYVALAAAIGGDTVLSAAAFMFLFGIGTIPALLAATLLPSVIRFPSWFSVRKLIPVITICFAILFLLRGLNLGIPYVSPAMHTNTQSVTNDTTETPDCCK